MSAVDRVKAAEGLLEASASAHLPEHAQALATQALVQATLAQVEQLRLGNVLAYYDCREAVGTLPTLLDVQMQEGLGIR